jgi:hypothetical protein
MKIEDGEDPVPGAGLDDTVEQAESLVSHHEGRAVVLEVAVAEGDPERVEPQASQEGSIVVGEEDLEEPIEERLVGGIPHRPSQRAPMLRFGCGIPGDEVLHVHPAAQPEPAEQ